MFPFILVPRRLDAGSGQRAGQWGGSLGSKYDPMQTGGDPNRDDFRLETLRCWRMCRGRSCNAAGAGRSAQRSDALSKGERPRPSREAEPGESPRRHRLGDDPAGGRPLHGRPRTPARMAGTCSGNRSCWERRLLDAGARLVQVNWLRTRVRKAMPGTATARISRPCGRPDPRLRPASRP